MDCRLTLNTNDSFLEMLRNSFLSNEKVFLLFDRNGMTRGEGFIKTIHIDDTSPFVELENGLVIALRDLVAVNGIFLSEYGEC